MVMSAAGHPFRPHLMSSLAVEQSCGLLGLCLGVIHRFDGLRSSFRGGRLHLHRQQCAAVIRTNLVVSDCRSRQSQQAQNQSSGWVETHLRFDCNQLSLMHKFPLDRFASYLASNGNEE
jgi:hypothetical protein